MYDNYNYPPGTDTPDAPWNRQDVPEINVDCDMTVILVKPAVSVVTDQYIKDESGYTEITDGGLDLIKRYKQQHFSITDMLSELKQYITDEISTDIPASRRQRLTDMLDDCQNWQIEDVDVDYYSL